MRPGCNNVHVHLLTISTKLASCVHEQKTWPAVGTIDGHGYVGQQKDAIYDTRGLYQMIRSTLKPVFHQFPLIG